MSQLTTIAEMEDEVGPDALLAWSDHQDSGLVDENVVNRAIGRATREIIRTAGQHYSLNGLSADAEIRAWASILACYFLCKTRANPVPDSLADDVTYIRQQLADLAVLRQTLVGVALKGDLRPAITNRVIDRRYQYRTVRKRPDSTGPPSKLRENRVDDPPTYYDS